ncbi:MAG: branched-chain amino acid aminotransferase [Alphaproteobacteria bacterium]
MNTASFDDRDGKIWMNGEMIDWRDARVHILTHAMHYASSVFEGARAYEGEIFKLQEHTERLFRSAALLDMEIPFSIEEVNQAQIDAVRVNGLTDAYLRPVVWRGSEMMGVSAQTTRINVAVATWAWPSYFSPEERLQGIRMAMSDWKRPSPETIPCEAKAAGLYMICTLSKHKAEKDGFADSLMLDYRGYIAEATGANVFFEKDGKLHTPTPDCILDGITRQTVIGLAKARGIEVIERRILPEEMADFNQCFITGTAAEVTPVSQIGEYSFTVGDITQSLMTDYDQLVRRQLAA